MPLPGLNSSYPVCRRQHDCRLGSSFIGISYWSSFYGDPPVRINRAETKMKCGHRRSTWRRWHKSGVFSQLSILRSILLSQTWQNAASGHFTVDTGVCGWDVMAFQQCGEADELCLKRTICIQADEQNYPLQPNRTWHREAPRPPGQKKNGRTSGVRVLGEKRKIWCETDSTSLSSCSLHQDWLWLRIFPLQSWWQKASLSSKRFPQALTEAG